MKEVKLVMMYRIFLTFLLFFSSQIVNAQNSCDTEREAFETKSFYYKEMFRTVCKTQYSISLLQDEKFHNHFNDLITRNSKKNWKKQCSDIFDIFTTRNGGCLQNWSGRFKEADCLSRFLKKELKINIDKELCESFSVYSYD